MSGLAVALLFGLGLLGGALRGARWGFAWVYVPILILTPYDLKLDVGGFPAITGRGVGALGLLLGAMFARSRQRLLPAWRWFDLLPLLTVLSFAVSYAQASDLKGFVAWAKGKPKPSKCPNSKIFCLDVWDPVVCDDGVTYSNQCYADRACATGCESAGGGPVPL